MTGSRARPASRTTGLDHGDHDPPGRKHEEPPQTPFFRLEQRAPAGAGVKDLRPLRGRPTGRSLTPTPQPGAPKQQRKTRKESRPRPLDQPHSFRDDLGVRGRDAADVCTSD
jgi:hypothetical protein